MALSDIVAKREKVEGPGGSFEVRGLSLEDIAHLLEQHSTSLAKVVEGEVDFLALVQDSPAFVAAVIACAAGEPDQAETARALPLGVQVMAVKTIWDLTAVEPEQLGNMFRGLVGGLGSLNSVLESGEKSKQAPLPTGPGPSSKPRKR